MTDSSQFTVYSSNSCHDMALVRASREPYESRSPGLWAQFISNSNLCHRTGESESPAILGSHWNVKNLHWLTHLHKDNSFGCLELEWRNSHYSWLTTHENITVAVAVSSCFPFLRAGARCSHCNCVVACQTFCTWLPWPIGTKRH